MARRCSTLSTMGFASLGRSSSRSAMSSALLIGTAGQRRRRSPARQVVFAQCHELGVAERLASRGRRAVGDGQGRLVRLGRRQRARRRCQPRGGSRRHGLGCGFRHAPSPPIRCVAVRTRATVTHSRAAYAGMHGAVDAWRVHRASPLGRVASRAPRVVISLPPRYGRTPTDRVADLPRGMWRMSYEPGRLRARLQTCVDAALQHSFKVVAHNT